MSSQTNNNPQAGAGRPLPKKEHDMFRSLQKHYDMKQHKKALKQADAILKKFPKHGETLAMKGLTLSSMGKGEEAHALVKEGLMNDMASIMCWHVFGLLHRNERNFNEAIKAYKRALMFDKDNLNILRDLSMLQVQMRDLVGFEETRTSILHIKPGIKTNWMALAVSKHLTGNLRGAVHVIDTYLSSLKEGSDDLGRSIESSELAMYKNSILAELPENWEETLTHLESCQPLVVDRGAWLLRKAECLLMLRDYTGAKAVVMSMLDRGMTENYRIHSMYMCALLEVDNDTCRQALKLRGTQTLASMLPLTKEEKRLIRESYDVELQPRYPKSYAVIQIPVTLLDGEDFRHAIDQLCRRHLSRGVPSLCHELHSLLWVEKEGRLVRPNDPVDIRDHPWFQVYIELADGYIDSLASSFKFSPTDGDEEPPSTIMWARYFRACLFELTAEYHQAAAMLDTCIQHAPDAADIYALKARVLSLSGSLEGAVESIDTGRRLDLQDRYMNNEATRYMLQAGMEEQALKTISMFAKHEGNPEQNLFDMQCSWYELEVAASWLRKKEYGKSLKKYAAILKHFEEIHYDQFDFHGYCFKKVTFRSYIDMLRFEDCIFGQEYYIEAALGTLKIYMDLYDNPASPVNDELDYSQMTAAERKKAKAIARKKKKATEKEADAQEETVSNGGDTKLPTKTGKPSFLEIDPVGTELLAKNPLEEATKLSAILVQYAPHRIDSWLTRYDVSVRRKKGLMALQALNKARSLEPNNDGLFTRTIDFFGKLSTVTDVSDPARIILREGAPQLLGGMDAVGFVKEAATTAANDDLTALPLRCAIAKAVVDLNAGSVSEACSLITQNGIRSRRVTIATCRDALAVLKSFGKESEAATNEWIATVKAKFPLLPKFE